jgi:hypothetical protein
MAVPLTGHQDLRTPLLYIFVYGDGWREKCREQLTLWMLSPAWRKVNLYPDEKHTMSSHELQSALMLTVEFSKMFYTMYAVPTLPLEQ